MCGWSSPQGLHFERECTQPWNWATHCCAAGWDSEGQKLQKPHLGHSEGKHCIEINTLSIPFFLSKYFHWGKSLSLANIQMVPHKIFQMDGCIFLKSLKPDTVDLGARPPFVSCFTNPRSSSPQLPISRLSLNSQQTISWSSEVTG